MPFSAQRQTHRSAQRAPPVAAEIVSPASIGAATVRSREKMSGQEDWQAEPPAPPMQANDLPLVAQAVPPASYIFSHLLRKRVQTRWDVGRRPVAYSASLFQIARAS